MICKCFQILCLLLLLNFQQLPVYIFVWIHLEGILFHTLVLSGPYCQINECLPLHPCYFVYLLARLRVVGLCWKGCGRSGHGQILR